MNIFHQNFYALLSQNFFGVTIELKIKTIIYFDYDFIFIFLFITQ